MCDTVENPQVIHWTNEKSGFGRDGNGEKPWIMELKYFSFSNRTPPPRRFIEGLFSQISRAVELQIVIFCG